MILPKEREEVKITNPRKLFIFSNTKVGKSTLISQLPNTLWVDLEDGSEFLSGMKINVRKEAARLGKKPIDIIYEISQEIRKQNATEGKHVYDYIALDTATALEEEARKHATDAYKKTLVGRAFTGTDVVSELAQGAGYAFLRSSFDKMYSWYEGLAGKCLIMTGHIKLVSMNKEGKDIQAKDILLTGALKNMVCADNDTIGYLYRQKENPNITMISFKTSEADIAAGSRSAHLRGQEFPILEYNPDTKEFKDHWNKIFL